MRSPGRTAGSVAERLLFVGGIVLFAVLVHQLGAATVLANLHVVGWGIVPIVLQEILAYLANTWGWRAAFPARATLPPFPRLLAARIAGDAVNYLTPTAMLGGEFIRGRMLRGYAPVTEIVASLAVAKLTQTAALLAFLVAAFVLVVDQVDLPGSVRVGVLAGMGVFAVALSALWLLQRQGLMFAGPLRVAERWLALRRVTDLRPSLERLDREIAGVHRASPRPLILSAAGFFVGWALGGVESYLILWFLGLPATFWTALSVEFFSAAVNNLFFFVPMRAGAQEAGKVAVFAMLGFGSPQGLAAGILYRIRELAWAFVGLALVFAHRRRDREGKVAEAARRTPPTQLWRGGTPRE